MCGGVGLGPKRLTDILDPSLISELEAIVFTPFFHCLDEVFHLRVVRILQHLDDLDESLLALLTCNNHLENTDGSATLALPEFGVWIEALENVECLNRIIELTHLVAIVGDQV